MPAYDDNPQVTGDYVWITAENSVTGNVPPNRRGRASMITAHKKRYERDHGVTLENITSNHSETCGFMHQTNVRYKIIRPVVAPEPSPKLTTIPTHLPPKAKPAQPLNARARRFRRNGADRYSLSAVNA